GVEWASMQILAAHVCFGPIAYIRRVYRSPSNAEPHGGENQQTANDVVNSRALTQKQNGKHDDCYREDVRYQGGANRPKFSTEERKSSIRTKSRNNRKKKICGERMSREHGIWILQCLAHA